jgi:hypothetical protein
MVSKKKAATSSDKSSTSRRRKAIPNEAAQAQSHETQAVETPMLPASEPAPDGTPISDEGEKAPEDQSSSDQAAKRGKLSALEAAVRVLGETGQAMSCPELIAAMAAKGYWSSPKGRTPASTLYASILRELQTKGDSARFRKSERGKFMLKDAV